MAGTEIRITGLRELNSALRKVDADLPKQMAAELQKVSQFVINRIRPKVPRRTGRARASMKARKKQQSATIAVGGGRAPYFPWLDFGGNAGPNKRVSRPFLKEGRYIYPTIGENDRQIKDMVDEVTERVIRQAQFQTKGRSTR